MMRTNPWCPHLAWLPAVLVSWTWMVAQPAWAHSDNGYSHDGMISQANASWMRELPDGALLSELSLPGTHDTMSFHGGDAVQTQSLSLPVQLHAGIRVLDIRARHIENTFAIHHGSVFQHAFFGDGVMKPVTLFLRANPTETVLIRLKEEYDATGNSRSFADTFLAYMSAYDGELQASYGDYVWRPNGSANAALSQVRGKIVFMLQPSLFSSQQLSAWGLPYEHASVMSVQDNYNLGTNWDLYGKWESIKAHLHAAAQGNRNLFYINYLSGSGGSFPYFVASGHSSPGTGASRLSTGLTTPGWNSSYPDFPRVDCFIGICTIAFEGTNTLTKHYLQARRVGFSGIVMADFPGEGLINSIIGLNPKSGLRFLARSQFNNKCLDLAPDSNLQVWDCHGAAQQVWIYEQSRGIIRSAASDKCLDAAAPWGNAYLHPCHYGANQQWDFLPSGQIRDRAYGQCLDLYAFNGANGANVQMYPCNSESNQRWTSTASLGVVTSAFNGKCLDLAPDSNLQMWFCHGASQQVWTYELGRGIIRSAASDKCLDAAAPWGNAYLHPCHSGANQQWDLLPSGQIRDRAYGQCLDLYAFNGADGANVQMYACNSASNQRWYRH